MNRWPSGLYTWQDGDCLNVSVPFTWELPKAADICRHGDMFASRIRVGGPAVDLMPDYLPRIDGVEIGGDEHGVLQRLNPLATRTTIGCPNKCGFCAVPDTEGAFCELDEWPDLPIICDNNILNASQKHFDRVCDRLEKHHGADFNQGLDARLLTDYHAERIARLPGCIARLALDNSSDGMYSQWERAYQSMLSKGFPKSRMRSYVIVGYESGVVDAWKRCEFVQQRGVLALPQWYHAKDCLENNKVLPCHAEYGWTEKERLRIMGYYYQHRGVKAI